MAFADSGENCLSFYYHMFGGSMGTLNLYIVDPSEQLMDPYWTRNVAADDLWLRALIPFTREGEFQVNLHSQLSRS